MPSLAYIRSYIQLNSNFNWDVQKTSNECDNNRPLVSALKNSVDDYNLIYNESSSKLPSDECIRTILSPQRAKSSTSNNKKLHKQTFNDSIALSRRSLQRNSDKPTRSSASTTDHKLANANSEYVSCKEIIDGLQANTFSMREHSTDLNQSKKERKVHFEHDLYITKSKYNHKSQRTLKKLETIPDKPVVLCMQFSPVRDASLAKWNSNHLTHTANLSTVDIYSRNFDISNLKPSTKDGIDNSINYRLFSFFDDHNKLSSAYIGLDPLKCTLSKNQWSLFDEYDYDEKSTSRKRKQDCHKKKSSISLFFSKIFDQNRAFIKINRFIRNARTKHRKTCSR